MQNSSSFFQTPSTPGRSSYYSARSHQPLVSSPLVSPKSSPVVAAQARRQAQYKTRVSSSSRTSITFGQPLFTQNGSKTPEDPQKSLLRERFRARCFERAQKEREEKVKRQRTASSSDVFFDAEMDCDEDEDDDSVMKDEVCDFPVRGFLLKPGIGCYLAALSKNHFQSRTQGKPCLSCFILSRCRILI